MRKNLARGGAGRHGSVRKLSIELAVTDIEVLRAIAAASDLSVSRTVEIAVKSWLGQRALAGALP
jgi:hypothetical protein